MKKFFGAFLAASLLVGCSSTTSTATATPEETSVSEETVVPEVISEPLQIIAPTGAPSLSLLPVVLSGEHELTTVDGPQVLQAELVSTEKTYDVVIAPTNLGVRLANAGNTEFKLLAVVTRGNMYIVGNKDAELTADSTIVAFGEQAVAGLVFKYEYPEFADESNENVIWRESVQEAAAELLAGNAEFALLAEPVATATIGKADEALNLGIVADLQATFGENGYPQAGLFVRASDYEADPERYNALVDSMIAYNPDKDTVLADLDTVGADTFGFAQSQIVANTWDRLNVNVSYATESADELDEFLKLFGIENASDAILEKK